MERSPSEEPASASSMLFATPGSALALEQLRELRAGDEDEVVFLGQPVAQAPEGLAQRPLDPVAVDRAADFAAGRDAQPHVALALVLAGKA